MRLLRSLRYRFRPGRSRELAEEMRFHHEQQRAEGLSAPQTERAFGNDLLLREQSRDAWGWLWVDRLGRDLRLALRLLRRAPAFTAVAVLSLAVGIGVNVAGFSLVDAIALRPLPVSQPQRLIRLDWTSHRWSPPASWDTNFTDAQGRILDNAFSYPLFEAWRHSTRALSDVAAYKPLSHIDLALHGQAEAGVGIFISGGFQSLLGIPPELGRAISPEDVASGAPPVALLSDQFWRARLGADPAIVGQAISVNHVLVTVIGIEPRGLQGVELGNVPDVYLPLSMVQGAVMRGMAHPPQFTDPQMWFVEVLARLRPGATLQQAQAELNIPFQQAAAALPQDPEVHGEHPVLVATSAANGVNNLGQDLALPMELLMVLTGLVMLIVCVNLANLLLARGLARRAELALRLAIGAGRGSLLRQLSVESFVLALAGAALSLPIGLAAGQAMVATFIPSYVHLAPHLDANALMLAAGLAVLATVLIGIVPALRASSLSPDAALRGAALSTPRRRRLGEGLAVAQFALCVLVLAIAGLFARTLRNLRTAPTGLDARNVTVFALNAPLEGYTGPRLAAFYGQVLDRLRQTPGITAASATTIVPGSTTGSSTHSIALAPNTPDKNNPHTFIADIAPGYFSAYRIHIIAGRDFDANDNASAPPVVIINRALAQRFTGLPVGQTLYWTRGGRTLALRVIGVVADAVYNGVRSQSMPVAYAPISQQTPSALTFVARSPMPAGPLDTALRGAVAAVDPQVPVYDVMTQQAAMEQSYDSQVMMAALSSVLGLLALALAAIGLYGLMAFNVARRRREFGVRVALGASPRGLERLVLRASLRLALYGAIVGLPLAWLASRAASSLLFGVSPGDPVTLVGVCLFLFAVALAAAWLPARRAAHLDPLASLRCE